MNALKKSVTKACGAVAKKLVSWYEQVSSCTFYELPEDFHMNKKVALACVKLDINAAVCGRLYHIYSEFPRDVRGVVTVDTFVSYFNIPQLELMRMIFTPFDEDGNGILDFEEFLLILCTVASYNRPELLRFLFNIFDMDGQGTIDTGEFNRMVQTMHAGNNMFPKAVGLAIQEYFEIAPEAAISGITYDQFRAADRNSPILLWPAFRVQERLQQLTLGVDHFIKVMNKNHPEIFSDAADLMLRRQQRIWLEIKTYLCCFQPCLAPLCNPDFNTKQLFLENCPRFYHCMFSIFCSCGRKSRLDVVDPFKVQREAAERAVLKKKRKEFLRRQELKVLFRLMFKWQKTVESRADCETVLQACQALDKKMLEDEEDAKIAAANRFLMPAEVEVAKKALAAVQAAKNVAHLRTIEAENKFNDIDLAAKRLRQAHRDIGIVDNQIPPSVTKLLGEFDASKDQAESSESEMPSELEQVSTDSDASFDISRFTYDIKDLDDDMMSDTSSSGTDDNQEIFEEIADKYRLEVGLRPASETDTNETTSDDISSSEASSTDSSLDELEAQPQVEVDENDTYDPKQMLEFELRQQRLLERQLRRQKRERAVQRELMRERAVDAVRNPILPQIGYAAATNKADAVVDAEGKLIRRKPGDRESNADKQLRRREKKMTKKHAIHVGGSNAELVNIAHMSEHPVFQTFNQSLPDVKPAKPAPPVVLNSVASPFTTFMATVGESQNLHMTMPKALRTNVKMPAVQQTVALADVAADERAAAEAAFRAKNQRGSRARADREALEEQAKK